MTEKQREFFAKYCADASKGALLAGLVGLGTDQVGGFFLLLDALAAVVLFGVAYIQEGRR